VAEAPGVPERYLQWDVQGQRLMSASSGQDPLVIDSWLVDEHRIRRLDLHYLRFSAGCSKFSDAVMHSMSAFLDAVTDTMPPRGRWFPRLEFSLGDEPVLGLRLRPAPRPSTAVRVWVADEPDARLHPAVKGPDLEYLRQQRSLANSRGADEALLVGDDGRLREGSATSLLWWRGHTVCAVPLASGVLPGVTRQILLERATTAGHPVCLEAPLAASLDSLEVWAVNALHGVRPITEWISSPLRAGPPIRAALWRRYLDDLVTTESNNRRNYVLE
jgi:branched-subunit amino acid aminotransferase/4-amino-4-deoxychorismate lyase